MPGNFRTGIGAAMSVLAACAAVLQPRNGRARDDCRLSERLGQSAGAAELNRELGAAGGRLLVAVARDLRRPTPDAMVTDCQLLGGGGWGV
ncbi:hypothetical protein ACFYPT_11380 [Streptomyces sp. NPDC005529]|uniref:hypothetical protein n=1 Tax=unclassified Streptomyces TaxID=2593676 RepID=UPI0033AB1CC6